MTAFAELAFVDARNVASPYLTPREVSAQIETAIRIHRREARRHQSLQCHFFHSV